MAAPALPRRVASPPVSIPAGGARQLLMAPPRLWPNLSPETQTQITRTLAAMMANVPARAIGPEQINARNAVLMREQNEFVSRFVADQLNFRAREAAKARNEQEELWRRGAGGR